MLLSIKTIHDLLISFPSSVGSWKNSLLAFTIHFVPFIADNQNCKNLLLWASEGLIYSSINSQKSCLHLQFCTILYRRQKLQKHLTEKNVTTFDLYLFVISKVSSRIKIQKDIFTFPWTSMDISFQIASMDVAHTL